MMLLFLKNSLSKIVVIIFGSIIFALMNPNSKIVNQHISLLMLFVYLFGLSAFLFHNHNHNDNYNDDHDHNCCHSDLLFCETLYQGAYYDFDCSHDSHMTSSKERCLVCDHLSNFKLTILNNPIKFNVNFFRVNKVELFVSLYVYDSTNTLNKSPPFII